MILFYDDSVVIHDLSFLRASVGPDKTDPKLVIMTDDQWAGACIPSAEEMGTAPRPKKNSPRKVGDFPHIGRQSRKAD